MRKIVIPKAGGYDRLELREAPDQQPHAGQVRIAVRHIGVNYADVVIRMGLYGDIESGQTQGKLVLEV
jgi:NADPH:quinone reductase-like Zn-dependent oxidoreductase